MQKAEQANLDIFMYVSISLAWADQTVIGNYSKHYITVQL